MRQIPKNARRNNEHDLIAAATKLAHEIGLSGDVTLEQIAGGRNNQVFKMMADDKRFLLKSYFFHKDDPRDRLGNEFSFLRYAWDKGIRCIPQPLSADRKQHVALYEFVEGKRLKESDIIKDFIGQTVRFVLELDKHKNSDEALNLPFASEACFSIAEHLNCVERRLKRLGEIVPCDPVSKNADDFIKCQLIPCWRTLKKGILEKLGNSDNAINEVIDNEERCLSPSDFGFHNALLEKIGILRFIDFEYAGWDDPAKMTCDFFCQPEVSVPRKYMLPFLNETVRLFDKREELKERILILFPVYKIKWCCILLNDFLSVDEKRRNFAYQLDNKEQNKTIQLKKSRLMFQSLKDYLP